MVAEAFISIKKSQAENVAINKSADWAQYEMPHQTKLGSLFQHRLSFEIRIQHQPPQVIIQGAAGVMQKRSIQGAYRPVGLHCFMNLSLKRSLSPTKKPKYPIVLLPAKA